jgi:sialate O-acetylesterase
MRFLRIACLASLTAASLHCWADPVLPNLFSDHVVLQQGGHTRVWGTADPAEEIAVAIADHAVTVTADARGHWVVTLPQLAPGGPFTLKVRGKKEIVVKDVMIGEVWLASGQSNMAFALSGEERAAAEVPKADDPQIRLFTVPKAIALTPQENVAGGTWQVCTPDSAKSFSAVAYFFARELHRRLNVPIGIVNSSWSGTPIEDWINPRTLEADPDLASLLNSWRTVSGNARTFAENGLPFSLEFDDFQLIPVSDAEKPPILANFNNGIAATADGGSFAYTWTDAPDTTAELSVPGRGGNGFAFRIAGKLDGAHSSFLAARYQPDGSPLDLRQYAGIRFWVRGTGSFRFRSLQPTISDWDDYGTSLFQAAADWRPVTVWFRDLHQEGWGVVMPFTHDSLSGFSLEALTTLEYESIPVTGLYHGMIAPVLPFAIRGAIWYQGESNALKARQYRSLLPALIRSWRTGAGNENLEFLVVQLPNYGAIPVQPGESAWAELREAQLLTVQRVPHTGLAVTIDVGDPKNIHPHRKLEVGQRLALWALGTTYKQPIVYSGPIYESMKVDGKTIRLQFMQVGGGLVARGGELQGFAIAGPDGNFHWANARIEGNAVIVSSPEVIGPVAVRYGWSDSPPCNLFNQEGLPASPFRTDDWPGITGGP